MVVAKFRAFVNLQLTRRKRSELTAIRNSLLKPRLAILAADPGQIFGA